MGSDWTGKLFGAGWKRVLLAFVLGAAMPVGEFANAAPTTAPALSAAKLTEITVPGTTPMAASAVDLSKAGYTEREFYAEGTANRYQGALPRSTETARILDGNWPYRTRVLVRTPARSRFNGTLVVEWTNVTAGQDVDFAFAEAHEYLLREGYAVAVVSAQKVGVDRLRTWSPARYGTLTVDVGNMNPTDGSKIDDCPGAPVCPGDALSWDIMTQISKALKDNAGESHPLLDLEVEKVIALGESQSAMRLTVYYNAIQPIYRFFDGFVFFDLAGPLRQDLAVPAISVNSESTAEMYAATNSSTYTRTWAVAGATHASLYGIEYVDALLLRDKSMPGPNGPLSFSQMIRSQNCDFAPTFSTVDHGLVLNTALDAVNKWVTTGKAAAPSRVFERDGAVALARDADGRVKGGIRLGQFVAPTAFLSPNGKSVFCALAGHHRDYTDAELKERYGSHQGYVTLVRDAMGVAARDGYILPFDRDEAIRAAEDSEVAR
ncbi:alpha/beta hydrolase domain-containing protein [Rhizobium sp. CF142]|uniref:alpha/beta hydrolase domain-containing protein n=1 Tax=Rhizobium sp. CF142 TaxID=1144314 RepID=UPI00026EF6A4|nr:alpha/beta hydrolase domain-containing protein [Rhizobium sp. CF142]EJJ27122.1 hypothetical protein PMI11_04688 [Rhizobium sp. CF142]